VWDWIGDFLNFFGSGWRGRIFSEMKVLIPILIGFVVVGCEKMEEPKPRGKAGTPLPSTAPVSKQETAKNYSENVTKPKPKTTGSGGKHLIHEAANIGNVERVKQLLSAGVDIDLKNKAGGTPLHAASVNGRIEVVKLLISKLANVNAQNKRGVTPLSLAIGHKHPEVAKLLRENGAKTAKELNKNKTLADIIKSKQIVLINSVDSRLRCHFQANGSLLLNQSHIHATRLPPKERYDVQGLNVYLEDAGRIVFPKHTLDKGDKVTFEIQVTKEMIEKNLIGSGKLGEWIFDGRWTIEKVSEKLSVDQRMISALREPLNKKEHPLVGRWKMSGGELNSELGTYLIHRPDHSFTGYRAYPALDDKGVEIKGQVERELIHGIWTVGENGISLLILLSNGRKREDSYGDDIGDETWGPIELKSLNHDAFTIENESYERVEKFKMTELLIYNTDDALKGFDVLKAFRVATGEDPMIIEPVKFSPKVVRTAIDILAKSANAEDAILEATRTAKDNPWVWEMLTARINMGRVGKHWLNLSKYNLTNSTAGELAAAIGAELKISRIGSNQAKSVHNARIISQSLRLKNGKYSANSWCDDIKNKADASGMNQRIFVCPQLPQSKELYGKIQKARATNTNPKDLWFNVSHYALNSRLSGKSLFEAYGFDVLDQITVFECDLGWNGSGGLDDVLKYMDKYNLDKVAVADGSSARLYTREELKKLNW